MEVTKQTRQRFIKFRVTESEWLGYKLDADKLGVTLSQYIRLVLKHGTSGINGKQKLKKLNFVESAPYADDLDGIVTVSIDPTLSKKNKPEE